MPRGYELIGASIFTVFCIILARIYSLINRVYTYWDKKNVKGPTPKYILGTWEGYAHKFLGSEDCSNSIKYGKVYGTYDGLTPNLLVTDTEIIKQILDVFSESFQDVRVASENSIVLKESLLTLCGGEKSEIQMLTNSLLNPSKFEKLVPKLNSSVEGLIESINKGRQEDGRINVTSTVSEFINDVVALTVFGIELNADVQFKDEFARNSLKIFNVKDSQSIKSLLPFLYGNYFKEHWICPEKTLQYFVNLVLTGISDVSPKSEIEEKTECSLIELLVEAAKEEKKLVQKNDENKGDLVLRDSIIISRSIATMLSLLNATKTTVLMALHTLASNEDVQERLYQEVEKNKSEKLSYEGIQNLSYLDQVMKEVMRLYPFEFRLEKVTVKEVKVGDVELDKNIRVSIPLYALHRSEELYPEADKFEPDRFSQTESERRNPFSYLPFGQAGINGSDFSIQIGILTSKFTLFRLVEKFKFSGGQTVGLHGLFKNGFTRIPRPQEIEIIAEPRN